jgi:hypothetical protein
LGAFPLVVPVLLAASAMWAAWRKHRLGLLLATSAFLAFCLLAGFSVGPAYILGGGAMIWALIVLLDVQPDGRTPYAWFR